MLLICSMCHRDVAMMGTSDTRKIKFVVCIHCYRSATFEHPRHREETRPVATRIAALSGRALPPAARAAAR